MPIYEYRCSSCNFQKEFLQKISDEPIRVCPECGQQTFAKLLSAAGFQLKGSGWYATDFKGGASTATAAAAPAKESSSESSSGHACGTGGCGACS